MNGESNIIGYELLALWQHVCEDISCLVGPVQNTSFNYILTNPRSTTRDRRVAT